VPSIFLQTLPNPSAHQTVIRFETRNGGRVQVAVYDPTGRRVRMLSERTLAAGVQNLSWDGRGDDGRAVTAGIYLIRVSTAEGTTTGRIVLIK
jgi:flagellar hook assembly protein FlgD